MYGQYRVHSVVCMLGIAALPNFQQNSNLEQSCIMRRKVAKQPKLGVCNFINYQNPVVPLRSSLIYV